MPISEAQIIPYQACAVSPARAVLVFAPHPDDEVFGCGGALALHVQAGHPVRVILLTAGGYGSTSESESTAYSDTRLQESARAAKVLGYPEPDCWGLADREVRYTEELVARMLGVIRETGADVVYAPSPWELHPDHQAASLAVMEAVRRVGSRVALYLYEVSAALRPSVLLDVSSVWQLKQNAMGVFASQEERLPYSSFVEALNRFRALTLQPRVQYAEGYERYTAEDLGAGGAVLRIGSESRRLLNAGVAVTPADMPLVSVIIRSANRPTLARALSSVALQTYSHLEIVVVDAGGAGISDISGHVPHVPWRVVTPGGKVPRSMAANVGLDAAVGEYLVFLDDDDWFYPDHIAKLVQTLRLHPTASAAHTGVECVDHEGVPTGEVFDFPFAPAELCFGNYLPIHAVLFHRSLLEKGCRFDPAFDLYEDWDFWLQVEKLTPMAYAGGVSAAYRIHFGAGEGVQADPQRSVEATDRIYEKWEVLRSRQNFMLLIGRSVERRRLVREAAVRAKQFAEMSEAVAKATTQTDLARQDAHHFRVAHDRACEDRDAANHQLREAWRELALAHERWAKEHESVLAARMEAAVTAQRLAAVSSELVSMTEARDGVTRELALARDHAGNLENAFRVTEQALGAARQDTQALLQSTSWRLTRPVRKLGALGRKVRVVARAFNVARGRGFGLSYLLHRTWDVYRREGLSGVQARVRRQLATSAIDEGLIADASSAAVAESARRDYDSWVQAFDTLDASRLDAFAQQAAALVEMPLVSIVMPVYKPQPDDLRKAIESVRSQIYPNWELCICDDASPGSQTRAQLEAAAKEDPRIRLVFHEKNRHISYATNSALELASGKYVGLLDHDDELRPHSLLRVVQAFEANPDWQLLYTDEDKIDQAGRRFDPYFKPDFNLGLIRSHNLMCHFAVYQRSLLSKLGGARPGYEGAQDYDLVLRAIDEVPASEVGHIPEILYHWRTAIGSTASGHANKSYAFNAGRRALEEHLKRRGLRGYIDEAPEAPGMYRVRWSRAAIPPLVSIVIPTRNGLTLMRQCLDSLRQTSYPNYEVIVVDNGSDDPAALAFLKERQEAGQIKVLRDDGPFNFSAINNRAVRELARGEFVLLMNNDIEITHPEWLDEMVGPAMEPGVGCVGARLWYPDDRLQHAGVILVCGVAGHAHKLLKRGQHGYMGRAVLSQDFVAVTAACLLVARSVFDQVQGLDESLAVAFNDVDFCLRVHQAGYRNHWTPYAELIHHESVSRGYEDTPEKQMRFRREVEAMQSRWGAFLQMDPSYNPNLTFDAEDFSLAWPPRHPEKYQLDRALIE